MPLPSGMTACVISSSVASREKSFHLWLPVTTRVAPFSAVKSESANMQLTWQTGVVGVFIVGQSSESRCMYCGLPLGKTIIIWPVFIQ